MSRRNTRARADRRTGLTALLAAFAAVAAFTASPSAAGAAPPTFTTQSVASGLVLPSDMAFTPDGAMVYSERGSTAGGVDRPTKIGVVLLGDNGTVDPDDERRQIVVDLSDVPYDGGSGVMSIVASPDFATSRALFTCQSNLESGVRNTKIIRWTIDAGYTAMTKVTDLVTIPWGSSARAGEHSGCRVRFGDDGHLYASTGDGWTPKAAQSPTLLNGKVLRIDPVTGAGVPGNPGTGWRGVAPATEFSATRPTAATIEFLGQLHVFGPSAGNRGIRHAWYDPSTARWWSESVDDADAGGNGGDATVLTYRGELHVFSDTRTGDGVRHVWFNGTWNAETLDGAGSLGTGLSTTTFVAGGQVHVFGRPQSGDGWRHLWFDGVAWNAETLDAVGTTADTSATTVYTGTGQLQVFGPAIGGGLRHGWFTDGIGWSFETLGTAVTDGQDATAFMYGSQLQVLANSSAPGATGHVFFNGTAWVESSLDAGFDPSQLLWSGDGALHVFGIPASGIGVRHGWYSPVAGAWNYETLDAPIAAGRGTSAIGYLGQLHVFGGSALGGLRQTFFTPTLFDARIYTYGHRNPQGLALQPGTGRMYSAEHGTNRDDEINLLSPGANFGWDPSSPTSSAYDETQPMTNLERYPFATLPVWAAGYPSIAPSGITFLQGAQWGEWDGALVAACLKTQKLVVLKLGADGTTVEWQTQTLTDVGRMRTPVQGPDGNLYVSTARGGGTDEIIKVVPTPI